MDEELKRLRDDVHKLLQLLDPVIQQVTLTQKNQGQLVTAVRSITESLDDLRQSQTDRNARVVNMAARQSAEQAAWIATLEATGLKPDPQAFERARAQFKAEHPAYYLPTVWNETPDWLQAMRRAERPA